MLKGRLLGECPDNFGGDVQEENGGDEGQRKHNNNERVTKSSRIEFISASRLIGSHTRELTLVVQVSRPCIA